MSIQTELIQKLLHGHNPYVGYPVEQWRGHWYNDPITTHTIFRTAIETAIPRVIIEVGSFVGESTVLMTGLMRRIVPNCAIICVDTWLGGIDHWQFVPEKLALHFGRPALYYHFIANIIDRGCQDTVVPLTLDSMNGARLLKLHGIKADMVYIDASHEQGDVMRDFDAYWELLNSGGVMLADDIDPHFPGVVHDWNEFVAKHKLTPHVDGQKGFVVKP